MIQTLCVSSALNYWPCCLSLSTPKHSLNTFKVSLNSFKVSCLGGVKGAAQFPTVSKLGEEDNG